uniref:Apolipoprotein C-I n=1 Tax=Myotis myotis TaxID=51298 RepID=A0A7J7SA29_MYOMY|nr:apolipoprotein C1 [Myotis myotis]
MKLLLSLSVLAVALLMVLEGPAPAQADSDILGNLQKPWDTMKDQVQKVIETVKKSDACHTGEMVLGGGEGSKLGGWTDLGPQAGKDALLPVKWISGKFHKAKESIKNPFS